MSIDYIAQLAMLPSDHHHPLGLPRTLASHLTQRQRLPRTASTMSLPQAWVEYRLLALLALSGWSLRWSLFEYEAMVRGIQPSSGTFKRSARRLAEAGLWQTCVVATVRRYALVRLTERGRELLRSLGLAPVESEWERIERLHRGGGMRQIKHTAAVCAFVHHARQRGYDTQVCPQLDDATAEPDVRLIKNERTLYVEVQRRGGTALARAAKWRNLVRLQGVVALCAMTGRAACWLTQEVQQCGFRHILATDLQTLHRQDLPDLWTIRLNTTDNGW